MEANFNPLFQRLNSALQNLNRMANSEGLDKYSFAVKAGSDIVAATNLVNELRDAYEEVSAKLNAMEKKTED